MTIKDTIIEAIKTMESERAKNQKESDREGRFSQMVTDVSTMETRIGAIEKQLSTMMDTKKAVFLILLSVLAGEVLHRLI